MVGRTDRMLAALLRGQGWGNRWALRLLLGAFALGGVLAPSPAWAATIAVDTSSDEVTVNGKCSLREAIINMNTGARARADCVESGTYGTADVITVPNLGQFLLDDVGAGENDAVTGDLDITKPMTIQGPSPTSKAFLNGQSLGDRVFHVQPTGVLNLINISINGGNAGAEAGGGILNQGTVALTDVNLSSNDAGTGGFTLHSSGASMSLLRTRVNNGDGPNSGAGITITAGSLSIKDSLIDNSGGSAPTAYGIRVQGGSAAILNSTISRNAGIGGTLNGGGLFVSAGTVVLNNVTLANNQQGIEQVGGTVQVSNTLVAANRGPNCIGAIVSGGYNLSDDGSCTSFTQTGDLPPNTDARVEATADAFGGPLDTHALQFGSPAVDAGNPATPLDGNGGRCVAADQRGVPRPQDGDATGGGRCDIGAFELVSFQVNATDDAVDAAPGNLICATATPVRCTLRAAIQEANAIRSAAVVLPASATPYTLSRPGLDATAVNGDLDVTGNIAIIGSGTATTIIDGNGSVTNDRVLEVHGSGDLVLQDVTVRNGNAAGAAAAGDGGGIRAEDGVLELRRTAVTGNRAARNGGGIASESAYIVKIIDSTIGENAASGAGGGVSFDESSNSIVTSSLIRGNRAANGGGLRSVDSSPIIKQATISGNDASVDGGGVLVSGNVNRETSISFSTIVNNEAATGGGLRVLPPTAANPGARIAVDDSIVSGNTGGDCVPDRITSKGYNLSGSATCGFTATGDRQSVDPKIGPLADNGGPTQTHALLPSSPALDTGDPTIVPTFGPVCAPTDQRGLPRPKDGDGDGQDRCDIGAFEQQTPLLEPCNPRPRVVQRTRPLGNGVLEVTVEASTSQFQPGNLLQSLRFKRLDNARVSLDGGAPQTGPFDVTLTPGRQTVVMTVQRVQSGAATTVSYDVVDLCGTWPTFVGGGPGAF